jgi:hypothetical protein
MAHPIPTRWAALGAAILFAPLSQPLLADGIPQDAPKPVPVFIARQDAAASGQAQPVGNSAPNPQQAAVIIYLPAGSQPFDLQALLAGASTPSAAAGRQPGPKPEQMAPARPSGPAMLLPQPRAAAPAPAPGLPAVSHALFPAHPQSAPLESQIASFVTNPPPRAVPVAAPVAQPPADSTVQSAEPRQRALIPASSLPLKINESEANRGFFEWPEGMRAKSVEDTPAPQSPIAKRTRAIFRSPEIPRSSSDEGQVAAQPTAAQSPEQAPRARALFSQRLETPSAAPQSTSPASAPVAPSQSVTLGPFAPEPPRVPGAPHEPVTQAPVSAGQATSASPQAASPPHSAPVAYAQPQPQSVPPQHTQPRALFSKPADDRPAVLSVAEQILGPNVLPPAQGQPAQPIASQPAVPSTRPRSKALLPKSLFVRAKPGAPAEPDPLRKYLPTNYPQGGTSRVAASASQDVPQPSTAPITATASTGATHSRSLFPIRFFGQQAEAAVAPSVAPASHQVVNSGQTPTLAAIAPSDVASDIARPNLQPMSAAAPGTSLALPSEDDRSTSGATSNTPAAIAIKPASREAADDSDWRPSKRRHKPATTQKAKEPKTEIATAEKTEPAPATPSKEASRRGSDSPAGQTIVKFERAVKPTPAVIVPLAEPTAAPVPTAERDETPLNNVRDFDTAVKRSSATEPEVVGESPAVATDVSKKRRPVIIRPEKHDESKTMRSNPVRVVRGGPDTQAGAAADVNDDEVDADHREVVFSSANAKRSKSVRPFPHGVNSSAGRGNPLR